MAITKIAQVDVGAGGAASIDFTSIPGTYTDLQVVISTRTSRAYQYDGLLVKFNGSSSTFTQRDLSGDGSSVFSGLVTSVGVGGWSTGASATGSTFSSVTLYIPNYSGSSNKSFSVDRVTENNGNPIGIGILAGVWATTAAITSISLYSDVAATLQQYSSATLYGISKSGATGATVA